MSRRYDHRSITLESIGAIGDIIKNLIKIDTEERIEKSKENIRDYYEQRQALNRRIAQTQRRRTELLLSSSSSEAVNFDQSKEKGQKDRVSEKSEPSDSVESGLVTESQEVIKIEDVSTKNEKGIEVDDDEEKAAALTTTSSLVEAEGNGEKNFSSVQKTADGIRNYSPSDNVDCITVDCSLCVRVEEKICETMMLYRLPQRVINAKTELSLHLGKNRGHKGSSGSRDTSRERYEKSDKEKSKRGKNSLTEYRHKNDESNNSKSKSKHHIDRKSSSKQQLPSDKGGETSKSMSKLAKFLSFTSSKSEDLDEEEKKKPKSNEQQGRKTTVEEKRTGKSDHSSSVRSKTKQTEIDQDDQDPAYLKQKSRGIKSGGRVAEEPNEILAAKAKLKRQKAIVKDESKESVSESSRVTGKVKQKEKAATNEGSDYVNTLNRIIHAREKIRQELGSDSTESEKPINRPLMNLIQVQEAQVGHFEKRTTLKTKSGHLVVDSISTYEESSLPDTDKGTKTSDTDNSLYESLSSVRQHKRVGSKKVRNEKQKDKEARKHVSREREKYEKKKSELEVFEQYQSELKAIGHKLKYSNGIDESMLDTLLHGMKTLKSDDDLLSEDNSNPIVRRHSQKSEKSSSIRKKQKNIHEQCSTPRLACPTDSKNNTAVFVRRKSPARKPQPDVVTDKKFRNSFKSDRTPNPDNPFQVKLKPTGFNNSNRQPRRSQSMSIRSTSKNKIADDYSDETFSEIEAEDAPKHKHAARIDDDKEMSEAEKLMLEKKQKQEEEEAVKLKEYEEQRRIEREKEEEELRQLKEKQERRRQEREEEERLMAERRQEEEARRRQEEEDRRKKAEAEKAKKDEQKKKRADMMAGLQIVGAIDVPTAATKSDQTFDKFGNIVKAKAEMGMTKEQHEEKKRAFLHDAVKELDLSGLDIGGVKHQVKQLHQRICRLEADKYDLEQRHQRQEYDLKELNERQRQISRNKALKKGLDPNEVVSTRYPPKVCVASKYDRQIDRRSFTERRKLYEVPKAIPHFPNCPPPPTELEKVIKAVEKKEGDEDVEVDEE